MARFYVEHNGEWNIFSTIVDDFLFDEFVCIDALKARLLYERFKELTEDIDSLMTDKPKVNVMPYEEAVRIADRKTESNSEKPNNCEHITEDGVTCAKYPACDDCLDNPLNKVKGSERLVKGSEQTDCQTCKWWSSYGYCVHRECKGYEPQTERSSE